MTWFFIALLGYLLLSVVFVLDKIIVTKNVSDPAVYTWYSTFFVFGALLLLPFGVGMLSGMDWIWAILSGVSFGFALWMLFIGLKKGETSHINPFVGAITTVGTYYFASAFLSESLTQMQLFGIIILVISAILFSFEKSAKHNGFHTGFIWAIGAGILFAASHVSAKYIYLHYDFFTGFVWTRATTGLVAIVTLFHPSVRALFTQKKKKKTKQKKNPLTLIVIDKILGVLAVILIQYAIAIGNTSMVVALAGVQFVFMFILVYVLTFFAPKLFKEDFTKKEVILQVIGIIFVVFGSALFVL